MDTQGLVLKAKVHSAGVMDWDGIKMLLQQAERGRVPAPQISVAGRRVIGERTRARIGCRRL